MGTLLLCAAMTLSSCLCSSRTDEAFVQMVKRRTLGTNLTGTWRRSTLAPTTGTRRSVWSRMAKQLRSFENGLCKMHAVSCQAALDISARLGPPHASVSVASTSSAESTPPSSRVIEPSYHQGLSSSVGTVRPVV